MAIGAGSAAAVAHLLVVRFARVGMSPEDVHAIVRGLPSWIRRPARGALGLTAHYQRAGR
ncbi:hypothetical protein [Ornithinimicrobium kibberense]|uniref:hypothetical protein n=1 Tax=Ornithinimicrobium kibberense TaxID=282060 RepID=UPI003610FF8E